MSFKAQELAHNLASELKIRLAPLFVVEAFDTNGDPTISIGPTAAGAGATTTHSAIIRVKAIDWPLAKDVLGLASTIYTPHVIQFLTENNTPGAGTYFLSAQELLTLLATISKRGTLVEEYNTANGVAVTVAGITGTPAGTYDAELYWNMLASQ